MRVGAGDACELHTFVHLELFADAIDTHDTLHLHLAGTDVIQREASDAHGGLQGAQVFAEDEFVRELEIVNAFIRVGDPAADRIDVLRLIAVGAGRF